MTKERLAEVGIALHGEIWKRSLAADLNVAVRTLERWADGSDDIPPGVVADLSKLVDDKIAALDALNTKIVESLT